MMSDREKVINGLETCKSTDKTCSDCPYNGEVCTISLCDDVLSLLKEQEEEIENLKQTCQSMMEGVCLLKEQEAVEPIPFFTETGAESPNYVICGHCKSIKAMMEKHIKQKYCHECGRKVKWE